MAEEELLKYLKKQIFIILSQNVVKLLLLVESHKPIVMQR